MVAVLIRFVVLRFVHAVRPDCRTHNEKLDSINERHVKSPFRCAQKTQKREREGRRERDRKNDGYSVDRRIHAAILCESRNSMSDGLAANARHIPSVKWFAIETKKSHIRAQHGGWRSKRTDDDEKYFEKLWTAKNVGVAYTPLQKNRNKMSLFMAQIRRHFVSF